MDDDWARKRAGRVWRKMAVDVGRKGAGLYPKQGMVGLTVLAALWP